MKRRAFLALCAALTGARVGPALAGPPLIAAHRGGALLWPENSLLAFRNAIALGVDFLELDVHSTADDQPVVIHDATADRTTTARGVVRDLRLADLRAARLLGPDGVVTGERVPTLAEFLDLVAPAAVQMLLEIKVGADRRPYPALEERVITLLRERRLMARTTVMSFSPEIIVRIRQLERTARTTLLVGEARLRGQPSAAAARWAVEAYATDLGIDHRALDAPVLEAARAAQLRVAAWTVNVEPDMRRVIDLGIDVLITDRPDLARRLVGR